MAIMSDILPINVLRMDCVLNNPEEKKKIEQILTDPSLYEMATRNPEMREAISRFVVKLKKERDSKRNNQMKTKVVENDTSWLRRYLMSFNCISWIRTAPEPMQRRTRRSASRPKIVKERQVCPKTEPEPKTEGLQSVFMCSPDDFKLPPALGDVCLKKIKLHLDGNKFPGSQNLDIRQCQSIAEMLLQKVNLNSNDLFKPLSNISKKVRVVHDLESSFFGKRFVNANFLPVNSGSQIIILNPKKVSDVLDLSASSFKLVNSSSTQTDEDLFSQGDFQCYDCHELEGNLDVLSKINFYDLLNVGNKDAISQYEWNCVTSPISSSSEDGSHSNCCSCSEGSIPEDPMYSGANFLSRVFREAKAPENSFMSVELETVIEGTGGENQEYSVCVSDAPSYESRDFHRTLLWSGNGETLLRRKSIPKTSSSESLVPVVQEASRTCADSSLKTDALQVPPEISTGYSDLSYRVVQNESEESDISLGKSDQVPHNEGPFPVDKAEIVPSKDDETGESGGEEVGIIQLLEKSSQRQATLKLAISDSKLAIWPKGGGNEQDGHSKECPELTWKGSEDVASVTSEASAATRDTVKAIECQESVTRINEVPKWRAQELPSASTSSEDQARPPPPWKQRRAARRRYKNRPCVVM